MQLCNICQKHFKWLHKETQEFTQKQYSEKHKNVYIIKIFKFSVLTDKSENKYDAYVNQSIG